MAEEGVRRFYLEDNPVLLLEILLRGSFPILIVILSVIILPSLALVNEDPDTVFLVISLSTVCALPAYLFLMVFTFLIFVFPMRRRSYVDVYTKHLEVLMKRAKNEFVRNRIELKNIEAVQFISPIKLDEIKRVDVFFRIGLKPRPPRLPNAYYYKISRPDNLIEIDLLKPIPMYFFRQGPFLYMEDSTPSSRAVRIMDREGDLISETSGQRVQSTFVEGRSRNVAGPSIMLLKTNYFYIKLKKNERDEFIKLVRRSARLRS
ncbi:MAG: hypothetical protein ACMUHU_05770 [Thermoplasmatota archaeon]